MCDVVSLTPLLFQMTCGGCSGAIERVLKKTEGEFKVIICSAIPTSLATGISSYDVSLEKQEVLVKGTIPYDSLLEKIKKTGKEVSSS